MQLCRFAFASLVVFLAGCRIDNGQEVISSARTAFDLDCLVRSKVVSDVDPHPRSSKANATVKKYRGRYHVYLAARKICAPEYCALPNLEGFMEIEKLTDRQLIITVSDGLTEMVDRRTGRYERVYMEEGRTVFTEGYCKVEPYSGVF